MLDTVITIFWIVVLAVCSLGMLIAPHFTYIGNRSRRYVRPKSRKGKSLR